MKRRFLAWLPKRYCPSDPQGAPPRPASTRRRDGARIVRVFCEFLRAINDERRGNSGRGAGNGPRVKSPSDRHAGRPRTHGLRACRGRPSAMCCEQGAATAGIKHRRKRLQTVTCSAYSTPNSEVFCMSAQPKLMPDVEGLARQVDPLARRGVFLTASAAAAAGYTLAAGPVRSDAIKTDTTGLTVGDAKVKVSDGEMPVYYARPANVQNPPVILVAMEIFGLHEYIKDVTRRLGKLGAFAIAPDYYFRKGVDLTKITDIPQLMPFVNKKPDAELFSDLDATVAWAKSQGGDTNRLAIIGFCRGGRTVWEYAAHNPGLKAGVAFYGSLIDPETQKSIWPKNPIERAGE